MTNEEEAAHRAEAFRAEHALGTAPIGDIFEFAHAAARIDVFSMDSHESEHEPACMCCGISNSRWLSDDYTWKNAKLERCHVVAANQGGSNHVELRIAVLDVPSRARTPSKFPVRGRTGNLGVHQSEQRSTL